MIWCKKCKKENPEEATHCMFCGAKLEQTQTLSERNDKRKRLRWLLLLIGIAVVILVMVLTVKNCTPKRAVNGESAQDKQACFVDQRDGNEYRMVKIGAQIWLSENLRYLPAVNSSAEGSEKAAGKYYYVYGYEGKKAEEAKTFTLPKAANGIGAGTNPYQTFGVLYNWEAAQTACPEGWHLPTDAEWKALELHLGMSQAATDSIGDRGKNIGSKLAGKPELWSSGNLSGNPEFASSGFYALPGGIRVAGMNKFSGLGKNGHWCTATALSSSSVWNRYLDYDYNSVNRTGNSIHNGCSVRCVRNEE